MCLPTDPTLARPRHRNSHSKNSPVPSSRRTSRKSRPSRRVAEEFSVDKWAAVSTLGDAGRRTSSSERPLKEEGRSAQPPKTTFQKRYQAASLHRRVTREEGNKADNHLVALPPCSINKCLQQISDQRSLRTKTTRPGAYHLVDCPPKRRIEKALDTSPTYRRSDSQPRLTTEKQQKRRSSRLEAHKMLANYCSQTDSNFHVSASSRTSPSTTGKLVEPCLSNLPQFGAWGERMSPDSKRPMRTMSRDPKRMTPDKKKKFVGDSVDLLGENQPDARKLDIQTTEVTTNLAGSLLEQLSLRASTGSRTPLVRHRESLGRKRRGSSSHSSLRRQQSKKENNYAQEEKKSEESTSSSSSRGSSISRRSSRSPQPRSGSLPSQGSKIQQQETGTAEKVESRTSRDKRSRRTARNKLTRGSSTGLQGGLSSPRLKRKSLRDLVSGSSR